MGTCFVPFVWPGGWPMIAAACGTSFLDGLLFPRSTERRYREDVERADDR